MIFRFYQHDKIELQNNLKTKNNIIFTCFTLNNEYHVIVFPGPCSTTYISSIIDYGEYLKLSVNINLDEYDFEIDGKKITNVYKWS